MIYPQKSFEHKIGFDDIRENLKGRCVSSMGVRQATGMRFSWDYGNVLRLLEQTSEMTNLITVKSGLPLSGVMDLSQELGSIRALGTMMSPTDLLKLRKLLQAMAEIARLLSPTEENQKLYPRLLALASRLTTFPQVIKAIDRVVHPGGDILDNASPELARIRSDLSRMGNVISSAMRRVMTKAVQEGYLEADVTPSIRDGRLVIPVAPSFKRSIPGIVHDESASGKTFYIEPAEVVEANNKQRELQLEEKREISRILIALADTIRPDLEEIISNMELLGIFDFINAKAKFALEVNASMPTLHKSPEIEWYGARHPGLMMALKRQDKEVVPVDIALQKDCRILLISGPNAGGKSVVLKTVAINQYMTQCGMLPCVYDNSHLGVFDAIMIDIGDDQSIDDDLSTYSSHLKNMKFILSHANGKSLALLDEPGSGTEPQIGAAIAQAMIDDMRQKGLWAVITTHFHSLKRFATETDGLTNGSMLYDRQHMQPLFKLQIGHPGSSFAVEIARKIGLPSELIDAAENIVGSDYINLDRYLLEITRDKNYWEQKRTEIRKKERQIEQTLEKYESEADSLRQQRKQILNDARAEASKIIDGSNAAVERTIREIREAQAEKQRTAEARERLRQDRITLASEEDKDHNEPSALKKAPKTKKKKSQPKAETQKEDIKVGSAVLLDGQGTPGEVLVIEGSQATVAFGNLKTQVPLKRLKLTLKKVPTMIGSNQSASSRAASEEMRQRQLGFTQEIDIRGFRVDEAIQAVTYYIDDAIQFQAKRVRILHGTGTGALRQAIRQYLMAIPGVVNVHDEDVRLGGAGITVVELA